jgi:hypothetical protein
MEEIDYLRSQERLYWNSDLKEKQWYREILGGEWRLLKLGEDTPFIGMFCVWTKMPMNCWEGYKIILEIERYPSTGINTVWKLQKAMLKRFLKVVKTFLVNII